MSAQRAPDAGNSGPLVVPDDPREAAKDAGLQYVTDAKPGITRRRTGKNFRYVDADGQPLKDPDQLSRIRALAIPPAWRSVWICTNPRGHIQATGRDARGRKQYKYHARWREVRDETKYDRMVRFGEALPAVREAVGRDLSARCLMKRKVLASAIELLDQAAIRVGNEEYARENDSFGLTTLRDDHVEVRGATVHLRFRGKGGKEHHIDVRDRRLANALRRCLDIGGQELFHYLDDDGQTQTIESSDVNEYLQQITGQSYTAKDFRTWHGTVVAARALHDIGPFTSPTQAKQNVNAAIAEAADRLGNTVAIARKSYVHPSVIDAYLDGSLHSIWDEAAGDRRDRPCDGLDRDERAALALLTVHPATTESQLEAS